MIIHKSGGNVLYLSGTFSDTYDDYESREDVIRPLVRMFRKRRLFREVIDLYQGLTGLEGYAILHAHGGRKRLWKYSDRKRKLPVQNWVNRLDGEYLGLFVAVCNNYNKDIESEKSIVVHLNKNSSFIGVGRGGCLRLFVPGYGYLDNWRKLRGAIDDLKD